MLNAEQIRAARGWLGLSQDDLARLSGVAKRTIARFEKDLSVPYERTLRDLQSCLEEKGIEFLFDGSTGVGIRIRAKRGRAARS
jgi:transcriptional regulator with XRE-family HTH domain